MTSDAPDPSRLLHAAFQGDVQTVAELLDSGCDVNALDPETEETALLSAIENGQVPVVELLLARGANPNQPGYAAQTPLQIAIDIAFEEAKHRSRTSGEAVRADTAVVSLLLAAGADPHQTDSAGRSALVWAKASGNAELERLCAAGS